MHPIERLRYVARAGWDEPAILAAEAAWALAELAGYDAPALVPACRRLLDRHPGCGPLWWVCARVLAADDPVAEAKRCAQELDNDTSAQLAEEMLVPTTRVVRRGGVGEVASADVVVVEAHALGVGGMVIDTDALGVLEAARAVEVPVWVEVGVGCVLPPRLWDALARRVLDSGARRRSVVSLSGVERIIGAGGSRSLTAALGSADCPEPPELLARGTG